MSDNDPPRDPTQFDTLEDGQVVRAAAEKVRRYARITNLLEGGLVAITCAVVIGVAVGVYSLAQTNRRGVERIIACTTPGQRCYEDEKTRGGLIVADALVWLNEEHLVIECQLTVAVEEREAALSDCRRDATAKTAVLRQQLQEDARRSRENREGNP